jgi:hypothetical protein
MAVWGRNMLWTNKAMQRHSEEFPQHIMEPETASVVWWLEFQAKQEILCFLWGTNWIHIYVM